MVQAEGKRILVSPNLNLIPDFAELVVKGRWTWNEGTRWIAEMGTGTETGTVGMTSRVLEKVGVMSTVPLL
jgi:hypothetical protein